MITDWEEINDRFDAIKDHKPKAAKKLNELGEILASAYKLDPYKANEMWQYIIELNVSDDGSNAKFYIAQVFNKITGLLTSEEATEMLALSPKRVQLLFLNGYDGGTLWHCFDVIFESFYNIKNMDNCIYVIELMIEKLGGLCQSFGVFSRVANKVFNDIKRAAENGIDSSFSRELAQELLKYDDEKINSFIRIQLFVYTEDNEEDDLEDLIRYAIAYKFCWEFLDLLWKARSIYSQYEIADIWLTYLENLDEADRIPGFIYGTSEDEKSFFLSIVKKNDNILKYYIGREATTDIFDEWIGDDDWDRFINYAVQMIENETATAYEHSDVARFSYFFEDYLRSKEPQGFIIYESNTNLKDDNLLKFERAMIEILERTKECSFYDDFFETIKYYIQKANGNLDILNEAGYEESIDNRTPEEKLTEYVQKFLRSGELVHLSDRYSKSEYGRIIKEIEKECEEIRRKIRPQGITINLGTKDIMRMLGIEGGDEYDDENEEVEDNEKELEDENIVDPYLELYYRMALNDDISEFYLCHCPWNETDRKTEMLVACIKKENISRAIVLLENLFKTADYKETDYNWKYEIGRVAIELLKEFTPDKYSNKEIKEEYVQTTIKIVERMLPYVNEGQVDDIKSALIKMSPDYVDSEEYVSKLMDEIELHTLYPRPKELKNRISTYQEGEMLNDAFNVLLRINRTNVILQIIGKYELVKERDDIFREGYSSAFYHLLNFPDEIFYDLYKKGKALFAVWIECEAKEEEIITVTKKICELCSRDEFFELRDMIVSRRGHIDYVDYCFSHRCSLDKTICSGDTVNVELKRIIHNIYDYSKDVEIQLVCRKKESLAKYICMDKCEINGIKVQEEYVCSHSMILWSVTNWHVNISSLFFKSQDLTQVNTIKLIFSVKNDNEDVIEILSGSVIHFDSELCVYEVAEQGIENNCCIQSNAYLSNQGNDDDEEVEKEDDNYYDDEENDFVEEFEDVEIINNELFKMEFCGIDFDNNSLVLSLWNINRTEEMKAIFAKNIVINSSYSKSFDLIANMEAEESDFYYYNITDSFDIDVKDVYSIELSFELDDEANDELCESLRLYIKCDPLTKEFSVEISESDDSEVSSSNYEPKDNKGISQDEIDRVNELYEAYEDFIDG